MPRALFSVYDKTGLVAFAEELVGLGWDIVASGGTGQALKEAGLSVTAIEQLTGMPEMLNGRVKSLHPAIHAGILATDKAEDIETLQQHGYAPINMVVCNLYPFSETIARAGVSLQDAIEQIDIGGVTLLRAAAKNFFYVTVVCSPSDYTKIIAALKTTGDIDIAIRRELAVKAFAHTRDYDTTIHAFLSRDIPADTSDHLLPEQLSIGLSRVETLRYGENPHQSAAYYGQNASAQPLGGKLLSGKQLSYNNILDIDAAWRTVGSFNEPTVCIVKHLTPTGIATDNSMAAAFAKALASDSLSAFGGVIAANREIDLEFVEALGALFVEAIAAPAFTVPAQMALTEKRKNCRVIQLTQSYRANNFEMRSVHNGMLVQQLDTGDPEGSTFTPVTERKPSQDELESLRFAWKAVQHVKSNAIVLAIHHATVGIGGGLPSRVDAAQLAITKAGERAKGAVMASDAFFPFADSIEVAAEAGITAIIQPGGSIRDKEVIDAANDAHIAMLFTGTRHFRH
ncbi:MAG: bifunctional phosphoribosylaminoimidazolecarboxamide formyltransferase/IMP cyclohydrolase PurH [Chloroflexi bacterium]|nr:MAG: bifunctional phosphoribosylaminoimidazolecarboxamide formyltransferase/inosine monophosphate cyclohydrolase [Phototrophicales bacterium]RMF81780.1 MAG: bifunctional phosphoribosylaminoimidazolecarboxamide formyltransferase/IMP cyclohydrolase PurH [Chloroflexota bacterium]